MIRPIVRARTAFACLLAVTLFACSELPTGLVEVPPMVAPPTSVGTFNGMIRLGQVPEATEIHAGGTDGFTVQDRVTGETLIGGTSESATITFSVTTTPAKTSWRLHVLCGNEVERDAKLAHAKQWNYDTYMFFNGECWMVYIGDFSIATSTVTERSMFRTFAVHRQVAKSGDPWVQVTTMAASEGFRIEIGDKVVMSPNLVVVVPAAGRATVSEQPVEGVIEVFRNAAGTLTAVNELPLEKYLGGVVPLVLPPDLYGAEEAQKAQAILERTRALRHRGLRAAQGFDFLPGEIQAYGGPAVENAISDAAIAATEGVVATFDGQLMDTPYHPASGGWTANSEDVFDATVPYLRGVVDHDLPPGLEHLTMLAFSLFASTDLKSIATNENGVWSKFHRWRVDWTKAEMAEAVGGAFGVTVNEVTDVRVVDRAEYGRVRRLEVDTDAGTLVAYGNDIRAKLRYRNIDGDWRPLSSTLIFVVPLTSDGIVTGWRIYGGGLGHGVGLSQASAVALAASGSDHVAILQKYYTGVVLEER
ncbi:MAG TPA: SpoIID/LytB domain-containing protein [Gemmatimonadaceae bacterium]|nr:SpoIID/LytB domain-containing protein [Gemmatimonadaceae bacterium]